MEKEYRIREEIGRYFNKRWIVQKKYSYYENGERVTSWHTVFQSADKKQCEKVLEKYKIDPQTDRRPFIMW